MKSIRITVMKFASRLQPPSRALVGTTLVVSSLVSLALAFSTPTEISVDGIRVVSDVPAITRGHEAYVPLRAIGAGLGASTSFDAKTGVVAVVRGADTLRLRVNDRHATLNGAPMTLAHEPFTVRGRVMVSLGLMTRALGSTTRYDMRQAKIDVTTPGVVAAGTDENQ